MDTNNLPTTKLVNGVQVPLTEEEINELKLKWAQGFLDAERNTLEDSLKMEQEILKNNLLEQFLNSLQ